MAFNIYFRAPGDGPMQQIFLSPNAADAAIVSLLVQTLPTAQPEAGVYKASFRGANAGSQAQMEKVAEVEQSVALVYASKDAAGHLDLSDAHVDPPPAAISPSLLQSLAAAAAEELEALPPGSGAWIFLAL